MLKKQSPCMLEYESNRLYVHNLVCISDMNGDPSFLTLQFDILRSFYAYNFNTFLYPVTGIHIKIRNFIRTKLATIS